MEDKEYTCEICGKIFFGDWRKLNGHKNSSHNKEANRKIALSKLGKHLTKEHKNKIGEASRKVIRTKEWGENISFALKKDGKGKHWNIGKKLSEDTKNKIREKLKIITNSYDFKENRRSKLIGRTKENNEGRRMQAEKISGKNNPMANPEYCKKAMKNSARNNTIKPNKPELFLLHLLNTLFPNEWKYVGDGEVIIAGKCPDFMNINGKKLLIELYGDYWHKGQDPQNRINIFKPYGYDTLVVWEKELKDIESLKKRLINFAS